MQLPNFSKLKTILRNISAFSFMEALFILLISGLFLGTFLPVYANTLKLKSDFKIRNFTTSENFSTISSIQNSSEIKIITSSSGDLDPLLELGAFLTFDNTRNVFVASTKSNFLTQDECKSLNTKEKITDNFEFNSCTQVFLKKIKSATNLYCFSVYNISEYSDGKWSTTKDTGIFYNTIISSSGSNPLLSANINLQSNPDTCVSY